VTRAISIAVALAIGAAASAAAAGTGPEAVSSKVTARHVQVVGKEFRFNLSRGALAAGRDTIEFDNGGQDDHDLAIVKRGRTRATEFGVLHPGERTTRTLRLSPGTYVLWCTLSDHKALGMRATIKVVR